MENFARDLLIVAGVFAAAALGFGLFVGWLIFG